MFWNAHGLGSQRAIRDLKRLIDESNPVLVFVCETKVTTSQSRLWSYIFEFDGMFIVDCQCRKGGLILMWRGPVSVDIQSYSLGHIDCIVKNGDSKWRFTGFYVNPVMSLRPHSRLLLRRLAGIPELKSLLWLVGGDFNEILFYWEKMGGQSRVPSQMAGFADTLDDCGLKDLNFKGNQFTWCNTH